MRLLTHKARWNKTEKKLLKKYYNKLNNKEIMKMMKRTIPSIRCQARKMNLNKNIGIGTETQFIIPKMSNEEWAYLTGIIDGEGSICVYKIGKYFRTMIFINNTNRAIAEWIRKRFGKEYYSYACGKNRSPCHRIQISEGMKFTYKILGKIEKYSIIKKYQIQLLKTFIEIRQNQKSKSKYSPELEKIANKIKILNSVGMRNLNNKNKLINQLEND
jgi:hypothetical protein